MKQMLLQFLIAAGLASCESLGLKEEKFSHRVENVQDDDFFVVENKKHPAFVRFNIEGELSHDAKIIWSDQAPLSDTAFKNPREILLPKGKINLPEIREDYYSKKLFVKYVSLNDSTAGNLLIRIQI